MAFPYGFLEVEITFGVVAKIMPYQVVVEILGSNSVKAFHECL